MISTNLIFAIALSGLIIATVTSLGIAILKHYLPDDFLAVSQNDRSNHLGSPRQLGGLIIVPVFFVSVFVALAFLDIKTSGHIVIMAGLLVLFFVGIFDDLLGLGIKVRLFCQFIAGFSLISGALIHLNMTLTEISLLVLGVSLIGIVYWVNIVNFMDGLDLLSFAGLTVPLASLGFLLLSLSNGMDLIGVISIIGAATVLGFAIHNIPPAHIFLGDSGSLFLGGVSATSIFFTAISVSPTIAVMPFLYYFCDGSYTICRRLINHQNIFHAHSSHAYQLAFRAGKSAIHISMAIIVLNILLAMLTYLAHSKSIPVQVGYLTLGGLMSGLLIMYFRTPVDAEEVSE